MKKIASTLILATLFIVGCKQNPEQNNTQVTQTPEFIDEHTSQNSLDWDGTYQTTLPCADCPGIKTTITLHQDDNFKITSEYLERDTKIEDSGKIMWHDNGSVVHLKGKETDIKLKVIENGLLQLDTQGNIINSEVENLYRYSKI